MPILLGMLIFLCCCLNTSFSLGTFLIGVFIIGGGVGLLCVDGVSLLWCHNYSVRVICISLIYCAFIMALRLIDVYRPILTGILIQQNLLAQILAAFFTFTADASRYLCSIFAVLVEI